MTLVDRCHIEYCNFYTFNYTGIDGFVQVEMDRSGSISVVTNYRKTCSTEPVVLYAAGINFEWGTHNKLVVEGLLKEDPKKFYRRDFTKLKKCLENLCSDN